MPILDMPLEKLKVFEGVNPRPADIDAFWDASIAEMEALGTGYELVPSDFSVPGMLCADLYFTGVKGARIHCKFLRPEKVASPLPAVCVFHGYAGRSPSFFALLSYVQAGFVVCAMDCRGQGGQSQDVGGVCGNTLHGHIIRGLDENDPSKLLFRDMFLDTAQMARIVMAMPEVDETRVGATGGSQGGGLTLACAALTPTLNRAAPQFPFLCDYKRVWDMDLDKAAYKELRDYFRLYDALHEREEEVFTLLGYIDNQHIAHRTRAEVMMITCLLDDICPPSTQFAAYNKLGGKKSMLIYPDYGHESIPDADNRIVQFLLGM
ncbi:MAG: acetylxylan esterase [Clostridia bacterium]|nr:acetylxylan esterase [Clostridia bacterium]